MCSRGADSSQNTINPSSLYCFLIIWIYALLHLLKIKDGLSQENIATCTHVYVVQAYFSVFSIFIINFYQIALDITSARHMPSRTFLVHDSEMYHAHISNKYNGIVDSYRKCMAQNLYSGALIIFFQSILRRLAACNYTTSRYINTYLKSNLILT